MFRVLCTFPSQYLFTIGHLRVFSLSGWCRSIPTGRLRPRGTQDTAHLPILAYRTITCYGVAFQRSSTSNVSLNAVLQPRPYLDKIGLGYSPFARHYLGNHYCFLFLRVLRCFSSPGLPSLRNIKGCPIRKSSVLRLFAPTQSLSQLTTSFIAFKCLGIPHTPFLFSFNILYYGSSRRFAQIKADFADINTCENAPNTCFVFVKLE